MNISEAKLRKIIRSVLLNELTDFGYSLKLKSSREQACPYYIWGWDPKSTKGHINTKDYGVEGQTIQQKLSGIFSSKSAQEIEDRLIKSYPSLKNDLGVLGGSLETLTTYVLNYSYVIGTGCLEYYFLSKALDVLSSIVGHVDKKDAGDLKAQVQDGQPVIQWTRAIEERAGEMAPSDTMGFDNDYPFYCLPRLSKSGPNVEDVDLLKEDLEDYQSKINAVLAYSSRDLSKSFREITADMDIEDTAIIRNINMDAVEVQQSEINQMKKEAAGSLVAAMGEAAFSYALSRRNNPEFDQAFKDFFLNNTLNT